MKKQKKIMKAYKVYANVRKVVAYIIHARNCDSAEKKSLKIHPYFKVKL